MKDHHYVEILLVEDNAHDAEMTILSLEDSNLTNHLIWVKDGKAALDFIFAEGAYAGRNVNSLPKVMLLDLKLPKVGGLDVLREIRADPRTAMMPVVVLTSSREDKDIIESYELGVNSYIVKPVDFDKFAQSVKEVGLYWVLTNLPPGTK